MSDQNPTPESATGWKRVTPETVFQENRYYVLLAPGQVPFVARWFRDGGLVDYPSTYEESFNYPEGEGHFKARFYLELAIPPEAQAECDRVWREYREQQRPQS
jgi:hypothetical protein